MTAKRRIQGRSGKVVELSAPALDLEEWSAAIDKHVDLPVEEVPPGWVTVEQLASARGQSLTRIRTKLNSMVRVGLADRKKFRIAVPCDTLRSVFHYKLKKTGQGKCELTSAL